MKNKINDKPFLALCTFEDERGDHIKGWIEVSHDNDFGDLFTITGSVVLEVHVSLELPNEK